MRNQEEIKGQNKINYKEKNLVYFMLFKGVHLKVERKEQERTIIKAIAIEKSLAEEIIIKEKSSR